MSSSKWLYTLVIRNHRHTTAQIFQKWNYTHFLDLIMIKGQDLNFDTTKTKNYSSSLTLELLL